MLQNCLIIYNPNSGKTKSVIVQDKLLQLINQNKFAVKSIATKQAGHAKEIAQKAVDEKIDLIIVIGGDGTINEVASIVAGSETTLSMFPAGSGNGYARSLKIKADIENFAAKINHLDAQRIDYGLFNGRHFFNVAGIGLDGLISSEFNKLTKRGFKNYLPIVFKNLIFMPSYFVRFQQGGPWQEFYWLSLFIGKTYGGFIRPNIYGDLQDGKGELLLIKQVPIYFYPIIGIRVSSGRLNFPYITEEKQFENLKIELGDYPIDAHCDGEHFKLEGQAEIKIIKQGIKVLF